jgi:hypothetical protein
VMESKKGWLRSLYLYIRSNDVSAAHSTVLRRWYVGADVDMLMSVNPDSGRVHAAYGG